MTGAQPSLRQLHAARVAADRGTLTAAARALNRTQPALSKSLNALEACLGVPLFDRLPRGLEPTPGGRVLLARVREAEVQFALAARAHAALAKRPPSAPNPVFSMQVSRSRLEAFLAAHELRDVPKAAAQLRTTRAAVYDSLRALEALLDVTLFESSSAGVRSSTFADVMATHVSLALSLLRHGQEEILSLDGAIHGRLVIGTLPYSRTILVPRAIDRVSAAHPALEIGTREGPYDVLERALRSGTVDLIIGATRRHPPNAPIRSETLFEDELAVICARRHPLAAAATVDLAEVLRHGWVLPVHSTPARQLFDEFLERHAAAAPRRIVETGSLSAARGLLLEGDWLALLSVHQVQLDLDAGLLAKLPVRLEGTFRPIGMTLRAHTTPSPAARAFMDVLRRIAPTVPACRR